MDKEELKQLLREQTETLMGGMEQLHKETLSAMARNKTEILDKVVEEVNLSERRLLSRLATREELREHDGRIAQLEQTVG